MLRAKSHASLTRHELPKPANGPMRSMFFALYCSVLLGIAQYFCQTASVVALPRMPIVFLPSGSLATTTARFPLRFQ
jgi:hypothetical protein